MSRLILLALFLTGCHEPVAPHSAPLPIAVEAEPAARAEPAAASPEREPLLASAVRLGPQVAEGFRQEASVRMRPEETSSLAAWEQSAERVDPDSEAGAVIRVALARYVTCELVPALLRGVDLEELASHVAALSIDPSTDLTDVFYEHLRTREDVPIAIADSYGNFAAAVDGVAHRDERERVAREVGTSAVETLNGDLNRVGRYLGKLCDVARQLQVPDSVLAPLWQPDP